MLCSESELYMFTYCLIFYFKVPVLLLKTDFFFSLFIHTFLKVAFLIFFMRVVAQNAKWRRTYYLVCHTC